MAILLDHHNIEDMAYDEDGKESCKAMHDQAVRIELGVLNVDDYSEILEFMRMLKYRRTLFGVTQRDRVIMEFERKVNV